MKRKLTFLLLLCALCAKPATAQTLERTTQNPLTIPKNVTTTEQASKGSTFKLSPSNKYNVAPTDVYSWLSNTKPKESANSITHIRKKTSHIPPAVNVADSVLVYGIFKNTADTPPSELKGLGIYSFHAAPTINFSEEAGGQTIPDAVVFVYVKGQYYLFNNGNITIVNASTGEVVKNDIELSLNGSAVSPMQTATYDPLSDKIFLVYWAEDYSKAILSVDPHTFETKAIGAMPGYPLSIAAAPDGKLYFMSYPTSLYSLDKTTGEYKLINDAAKPDKNYQNGTASQTAAFDWSTGMMYLANLTADWNTHLTKIDPATGNAVNIADFPGKERIVGLFIPYSDADTPGFASQISYTEGKLNFTAPVNTYSSGKQLSGNLTAYITTAGNTTELNVEPGQKVSLEYTLAEGKHSIEIEMGNTVGKSPARRLNTFVGQDLPTAVTDLNLSIDDGKNAVLTWKAPATSQHGGPVDDASLNYLITRYPDEVIVATGLKETSYTETIPEVHARYYYTVTVYSDDNAGATVTSNIVTAGAIWFPPYIETFETQADFDSFKIIDANKDGKTWSFMNPLGQNGQAYLQGNGTRDVDTGIYDGNGNDDYFISPLINLKKDVDYRLSLDTYDQFLTTEHMTILLGKKQDVTGDETQIASLDMHSNQSYTIIFNVPEDGLYTLLFHGDSPAESVNVSIDNLSLDVYSFFNGPDCVTDVQVKAGEKGVLNNTLTFTTPSKTYKGGTLSSISYVKVYRNGSAKAAQVFNAPKVNETLTWTDTDVEQGNVTYRIVAFNDQGQGKEYLITNWVGLDMPADVSNLKVKMNAENKAVVTYDKVGSIGKHGGYVNPAEVKYVLCRYNEYNFENHWEEVTEYTQELTLTDETFSPMYGARQQYVDYLLVATNSAGSSDGAGTGIVLGEPYERPYKESFAGALVTNAPWTLSASSYYYAWNMVTGSGIAVKPYDNDEGMLQFSYIMDESNTQVMMGPRISLSNSTSPELTFYMYHGFEAEEGDLTLKLYVNYDDEEWENIADIDYNNGSYGWSRFSLPLRTDADNVQIAFGAHAADASASIYVDAIRIDESVAHDIAVESVAITSKRIEAGENTQLNVGIANYGVNAAQDYKVILLRDGQAVDSKQGETLAQNSVGQVTFEITTTKADASANYSYQAAIEYELDANKDNDLSNTVRLYVHGSNLPVAENLSGTITEGVVTLQWDKPAKSEIADQVTDDFDSYESFIIDNIGDWKTYDGDGTPTVYFGGPQIAHAYEAKAWQVWAPEEAGFSLDKFDVLTPHSGDKYLTCWAASDGVTQTLPNDDWLISSDVMGGTDVSFYYRMPNEGSDPQVFEMMYSSTDQEPENFTAFDRDSIMTGTDWVQFDYTLPTDAKYFAIRSCSKGSYTVALLDDITYTPLYGSTTTVTLTGYNVYRDNQLIAANVTEQSYTDNTAGTEKHVYNVTAVWKEGESNYSNKYVSSDNTDIDKVATEPDIKVYSSKNAIIITGAEGKPINIYAYTGQKLFSKNAATNTTINVVPGVYLVHVANTTHKVIVK